jgi:hypothetical protein
LRSCQFTTGVLNRIRLSARTQADCEKQGVVVLASAIEIMPALHIPDFIAKYHPDFYAWI